jgi:hypothetical protein
LAAFAILSALAVPGRAVAEVEEAEEVRATVVFFAVDVVLLIEAAVIEAEAETVVFAEGRVVFLPAASAERGWTIVDVPLSVPAQNIGRSAEVCLFHRKV